MRPPRILCLETSGRIGSIALAEGPRCLEVRTFRTDVGHAAGLLPQLAELARRQGWPPEALDHVYLSIGPGSFTGVRAGVAAARALALALGRQVIAVNTLEVLAAAVGVQPAGTIVAAVDARRKQVYVQIFDHRLVAQGAPCVVAPEEVRLEAAVSPLCLVGSGADLIRAVWPNEPSMVCTDAAADARGVARRALARLAAGERACDGHSVQPLYLRPPDARLPTLPQARVGAALGA